MFPWYLRDLFSPTFTFKKVSGNISDGVETGDYEALYNWLMVQISKGLPEFVKKNLCSCLYNLSKVQKSADNCTAYDISTNDQISIAHFFPQ